ncbi:hypothetical protein MTYP_02221 [Methylophilaceae bacterium]|nr:hypothetical protein MTYP_02221 [Methylophilaceae bacterium]
MRQMYAKARHTTFSTYHANLGNFDIKEFVSRESCTNQMKLLCYLKNNTHFVKSKTWYQPTISVLVVLVCQQYECWSV